MKKLNKKESTVENESEEEIKKLIEKKKQENIALNKILNGLSEIKESNKKKNH